MAALSATLLSLFSVGEIWLIIEACSASLSFDTLRGTAARGASELSSKVSSKLSGYCMKMLS